MKSFLCSLTSIAFFLASNASAFAPISSSSISSSTGAALLASSTNLHMMEGLTTVDVNVVVDSISSIVSSTPSLMVSETEAWVQPLATILGPFLNIFSFAMLCRVVISWYPTANLNEPPYNIVAWPTEPLLRLIRGSVPPAFGVDITPIVWLAIFTFFNEILLGQQGLLTMKMKYGI